MQRATRHIVRVDPPAPNYNGWAPAAQDDDDDVESVDVSVESVESDDSYALIRDLLGEQGALKKVVVGLAVTQGVINVAQAETNDAVAGNLAVLVKTVYLSLKFVAVCLLVAAGLFLTDPLQATLAMGSAGVLWLLADWLRTQQQ